MQPQMTRRQLLRALLVEDQEDDALLLLRQLRQHGYEVTHRRVWDEPSMRAALREEPWEIVLCDYFMPGFNAMRALEVFQEAQLDIPFVVISGSIGEDIAVAAMRAGVHDYVMKDKLTRLGAAVERELRDAAGRRERRRMELERVALLEREAQARAEAERQAVELARANADLERFTFAASHDLQEPLRMVGIYTQLLLRRLGPELQDQAELAQYAEYIRQGVKRMETLTRDLVDYARVAHEDYSSTHVDLNSAVDAAWKAVSDTAEAKEAVIERVPLPPVQGEFQQLVKVFQSLFSNALLYHDPDQPPRIEITCSEIEGRIAIHVRDHGIGIPAEFHQQIFGIFKRLQHSGRTGNGVGLALAKRIVERHGGYIWVDSQPGEGAVFTFTLPKAL